MTRRMTTLVALVVAWVALAASSAGQIASSMSFDLDGFSIDATSGGSSSQANTNYVQIGPLSFEETSSTNFVAEVGFLASFDPDPGDAPVIYGVRPRHAHKSGGTPMTIYGRNLGFGVFHLIRVGGVVVTNQVLSDTLATAVSPAGAAGPVDVQVSHADGSDTLENRFVLSPAITMPEFAYQDSIIPLTLYGTFGNSFQTWASTTTLDPGVNTNFGLLLIGPVLINVIAGFPYLTPEGITEVTNARAPISPLLVGFTIYLQNVDLDPGDPPGQLTNRTETTFF